MKRRGCQLVGEDRENEGKIKFQKWKRVVPPISRHSSTSQIAPLAPLAAHDIPHENKNGDLKVFFYSLPPKDLYLPTFAVEKIFAQKCSPPIPYIEGDTFFDRVIPPQTRSLPPRWSPGPVVSTVERNSFPGTAAPAWGQAPFSRNVTDVARRYSYPPPPVSASLLKRWMSRMPIYPVFWFCAHGG
jgi:hypothetical protein